MAKSYWDYYRADYKWDDQGLFPLERRETEDAFSKAGFNDAQVQDLINSGYIVSGPLVIDRYYGGLLLSSDSRSRIRIEYFLEEPIFDKHPAYVCYANSEKDLRDCINKWTNATSRRLLFRGQNCSYPIKRPRQNRAYAVEGFGEISLVPSLWRQMLKTVSIGRETFTSLSLLEWSKILYARFDLAEVERRQVEALKRGEWMYTPQDMEDSDDPVLHAFGKQRLDLIMGLDADLARPTQTLLQHYGLLSPFLDLTTDLDVALFFATHKFERDRGSHCRYEYIGTNNGQSVIYVLRENPSEMLEHGHHRALETLKPLRPLRQSCVISFGGMDAFNLPLEFLFGVVVLQCDDPPRRKYGEKDLFPSRTEDIFLATLLDNLLEPQLVTTFQSGSSA